MKKLPVKEKRIQIKDPWAPNLFAWERFSPASKGPVTLEGALDPDRKMIQKTKRRNAGR